jgi:succinate dehydrogenase / fumarate reductase cytochrome b subunit
MAKFRLRQNYLGIRGWIWAGNYKLERSLYLFHRITGLGLLLFLIFHLVITTVFRVQGRDVWETTMAFFSNPWFKAGEYLVCIAFAYHALNGLRLILQELGFALGKPEPPVYPYRDSLSRKRYRTLIMLVLVVLLSLLFLYGFMQGGW